MGVYIAAMENPKTCGECVARHLAKCGVTIQWLLGPEEHYKNKKEDCPLVEIVTCGECKHREKNHYCIVWGQPYLCNDEAFCSYGERKK